MHPQIKPPPQPILFIILHLLCKKLERLLLQLNIKLNNNNATCNAFRLSFHLCPRHRWRLGQQEQDRYDLVGYSAALGGTLLTASNFVCMRRLRAVHFSVLIFAFSVSSAALSAAAVQWAAEFRCLGPEGWAGLPGRPFQCQIWLLSFFFRQTFWPKIG